MTKMTESLSDINDINNDPVIHGQEDPITQCPSVHINSLLLAFMGSVLLCMQTYLSGTLPDPRWAASNMNIAESALPLQYSPLIPMSIFLGGLLGRHLSIVAVGLYLVAGLFFFPIFANGGGLHYLEQPGAGYLLGILVAAYTSGSMMPFVLRAKTLAQFQLNALYTSLITVVCAHGFGSVVLALQGFCGQYDFAEWRHWENLLTISPFFYDIVVTFALLSAVRIFRNLLWVALY
ncbi:MAG: biotin transporter BioY [Cyanobacteria bacterium]|nr:biotin transporter BioY [Cyanobacteriota bacterium]